MTGNIKKWTIQQQMGTVKISIDYIGGLSVNKKHISLQMQTDSSENAVHIKKDMFCALYIDGEKVYGDIFSFSPTSSGGLNIRLRIKDEYQVYCLLYPYHHSDIKCFLLTEEIVSPEIVKQAKILLGKLSALTGKSKQGILLDLTAFKPGVEGRDDIRFISGKQMPVIIEKMEEMIKGNKAELSGIETKRLSHKQL